MTESENNQFEENQEPVNPETQAMSEKMLPQSQVNKIAAQARSEGVERARKEYEAKLAESQSSMGGISQMSPEHLQQMIAEAAQKHVDQQARMMTANKLVHEFTSKVTAGSAQYPDFEEKVSQLRLDKNPLLVVLANSADNTAGVLYDLANHPHKIGNILALANNPATEHLAQLEIMRLSKSIKDNEDAQKQAMPADPLSQLKPSTLGKDNGVMSVKDLRGQDWLRA
jgi:hypothetical protein